MATITCPRCGGSGKQLDNTPCKFCGGKCVVCIDDKEFEEALLIKE